MGYLEFSVYHPERCLPVALLIFVAAALFYIFTRRVPWLTLLAGLSWLLLALHEHYCKVTGANIRLDLFLIHPVMYFTTVCGLLNLIPWRNLKSFSLRSLFFLMTIVAIAAALHAYYSNVSLRKLERELVKLRAWSEFELKSSSDFRNESYRIILRNRGRPTIIHIFRTPLPVSSKVNGQKTIKRVEVPNGFLVQPLGQETKNIDEAIELIRSEFKRTE